MMPLKKTWGIYWGSSCFNDNIWLFGKLAGTDCADFPKIRRASSQTGDEVITVAAGFPTTVNPAIQNGLIPVFVDVDIPTYNIDASLIEAAVTEKSKAIMIAHTLGNAFNLSEVRRIADKYNLWLIEDCCDALGTTYEGQMVGTFGDIGTVSFIRLTISQWVKAVLYSPSQVN